MGERDAERGAVETLLGTGTEEPDDPSVEALRAAQAGETGGACASYGRFRARALAEGGA